MIMFIMHVNGVVGYNSMLTPILYVTLYMLIKCNNEITQNEHYCD